MALPFGWVSGYPSIAKLQQIILTQKHFSDGLFAATDDLSLPFLR